MKLNLSVTSVFLIVVLTVAASAWRIGTAPERRQMRLDTARQTCTGSGGEWIKTSEGESCRSADERKKS